MSIFAGNVFVCSGSLFYSSGYVLTAASCTFKSKDEAYEASELKVVGGLSTANIAEAPVEQQVDVSSINRHKDYIPGQYDNNIAILKVSLYLIHFNALKFTDVLNPAVESLFACDQCNSCNW